MNLDLRIKHVPRQDGFTVMGLYAIVTSYSERQVWR